MNDAALIGGAEIYARVERLMRGEELARRVEHEAGKIPSFYGANATSWDVCEAWLRIWRMATLKPGEEAFYQSNAIGWASR